MKRVMSFQTGTSPSDAYWNKMFWILQLTGWSVVNVIILPLYFWPRLTDLRSVIGVTITQVAGFIMSTLLRYLYRGMRLKSKPLSTVALTVAISSIVGGQVWIWFDMLISSPVYSFWDLYAMMTVAGFFRDWLSHTTLLLLWSALYFAIQLWFDWSLQRQRAEEANQLAHSAQLQMLRYQLNPHFLFNALNSIRALIGENTDQARRVVTELAEFLRYALITRDFRDVPLRDEVEAIRHYFEIQKIRYEDRLDAEIDVESACEEFPVLSFLIHPLIENAIKYGMQTSTMPLRVRLTACCRNGQLQLTVSNTGKWIDPADADRKVGTGTGIENVRQRLQNAFPDRHSLEVAEEDGWIHVRLSIQQEYRTL